MKALTIKQPWASAIIRGPKRVENRTWKPWSDEMHLHWLVIHAGKTMDDVEGQRVCQTLWPEMIVYPEEMGSILGAAHLIDIVHIENRRPRTPWAFGPWCWVFGSVARLETPIPCRGNRKLWNVPAAHHAAILKAIKGAG